MTERKRLESAIAALQGKRASLGDAVVDAALPVLIDRLREIEADEPFTSDQSLRLVTVLFTDVVDSVRLSQRLDPEDIQWVIDRALARFRDVVEAHGGRVLQYAGDSMLAAFGVAGATESDAEQAITAGLEILEQARRHAGEVRTRHADAAFSVRVGIHSGSVLLGGGVDAEGAIRGMAVNIAARLEQSAPPGTVRISHAAYALARGVFDVTEEAPLALKGLGAPIRSYLVHRAKPRAFRSPMHGIEGVETGMIGRELEIELLQAAFRHLYQEPNLVCVTVVAEAGIGKSRLLHEFQSWAELRPEPFLLFQGRAYAQSEAQPYALLRNMLAWRMQISGSESMESAKSRLEGHIVPLFVATGDDETTARGHAHLLGQLLGLDYADSAHVKGIREDGQQIRNRGFHAAAQMFRRLTLRDRIPVVVLLEDLHWADEGSLEFLAYLALAARDVPVLILGAARPLLFERRPEWPAPATTQRIELHPLEKGASRQLATELLKGLGEAPPDLRELVSASAEGNPFYMEELVKMLIDEGAIETRAKPWQFVPERLLAIEVPPTLVGILQARLDKLLATEKLALQQASVMGVVFWEKGLAAIDARSPEAMPALADKALIHSRGEMDASQGREFVFAHHILRRVTYETLLKQSRRVYHARIAAWLQDVEGPWAKDLLGTIADHHDKAGNADAACDYFAAACEDAVTRNAGDAVDVYSSRAIALLAGRRDTVAEGLRWRLYVCVERLASARGRRSAQQMALDAMLEIATSTSDDRRLAHTTYRRSDLEMRLGRYASSKDLADEAIRLAEKIGDVGLKLRSQTRLAATLHYLGKGQAALTIARESLELARTAGLKKEESLCLNIVSVVSLQDDPLTSLEAEGRQLALCREVGDALGVAEATCNTGASLMLLGDLPQAEPHLREGLNLARGLGERDLQPYPLLNLSALAWRRHDDIAASTFARAALEIAVESGSRLKESGALFWLGNAELGLGNVVAAKASFERAHAIGVEINHAQRFDAASGLIRMAMMEGRVAAALSYADPIVEHLEDGGSLNGSDVPRLVQLTCHQWLCQTGDARADRFLERIHADLNEQAARIDDPSRRATFLALEEHQAILAAWEALRARRRNQREC